MKQTAKFSLSALTLAIALVGCDSDDKKDEVVAKLNLGQLVSSLDIELPTTYSFETQLAETTGSSVSYTGQSLRQVILNDLNNYMGSDQLATDADNDQSGAAVLAKLISFYEFNSDNSGANNITTAPKGGEALLQTTYNDISSGKNLKGKVAGQDNPLSMVEFIGWSTGLTPVPAEATEEELITYWRAIPNELINDWFEAFAAQAADQTQRMDPTGAAITKRYLSETGVDYKQLLQKFLLGAVNYSQASEDYLKSTKGLTKQNTTADKEGKTYTSLEHQWDEGFGYFGAARNYAAFTDDEIAGKPNDNTNDAFENGYNDANLDTKIDLISEFNFGHSVNAAKRDRGAEVSTDYTAQAFTAFLAGRQLINDNVGTNPEGAAYSVALVQLSAFAQDAWEKAIAATVVHYINDVVADIDNFDAGYSFADYAKHWSEMKGFMLGLQFSPIAGMTKAQQVEIHAYMGEAPVLSTANAADITAYRADLLKARAIIGAAYEFDAANVTGW